MTCSADDIDVDLDSHNSDFMFMLDLCTYRYADANGRVFNKLWWHINTQESVTCCVDDVNVDLDSHKPVVIVTFRLSFVCFCVCATMVKVNNFNYTTPLVSQ